MTTKILLVTVTKVEATQVLNIFSKSTAKQWERRTIKNQILYFLGKIGGAEIYMVQSEMGTTGLGASIMTIRDAIDALSPNEIIMIGVAFGVDPLKQKLGDILVSKQLILYEPAKIKGEFISRGDRVSSSPPLLRRFRSGEIDWKGAKVHIGLMLSGDKLIADQVFRDWLLRIEPEAVGGEMEGAGLYVAAHQEKVDWIVVKGICDWADGNKNDKAQALAARNAASFVSHVLKQGNYKNRNKIVQLIIDKDIKSFKKADEQVLIATLAAILKVDKEDIRLLRVSPGSIVLEFEMPNMAVSRLFDLVRNQDSRIMELNIRSIKSNLDDIVILDQDYEISSSAGYRINIDPAESTVEVIILPLQSQGVLEKLKRTNPVALDETNLPPQVFSSDRIPRLLDVLRSQGEYLVKQVPSQVDAEFFIELEGLLNSLYSDLDKELASQRTKFRTSSLKALMKIIDYDLLPVVAEWSHYIRTHPEMSRPSNLFGNIKSIGRKLRALSDMI